MEPAQTIFNTQLPSLELNKQTPTEEVLPKIEKEESPQTILSNIIQPETPKNVSSVVKRPAKTIKMSGAIVATGTIKQ